jgi:hypothetical protein
MPDAQNSPERVFMHDISTPVAVALGMIDMVIDDSLSGVNELPERAFKRLEKAQAALLKLQKLMVDRRKEIFEPPA